MRSPWILRGVWPALLLVGLVACAPAGRPVRFASPLIGGAELPSGRGAEQGDRSARDDERRVARRTGEKPERAAAVASAKPARPAPLPVRTQRTAPAAPVVLGAKADPMDPRSWVGARDDSDPMVAVLELCRRRYPRCPAQLPELPDEEAPARGGWLPPATAFGVGDLLLFDRVGLDNKEQLVALVTARQARGVFELAYLAAGVWRRGLIDPARPRLHRDGEGRVVNTFLRHRRATLPAKTRFLTGELLIGVLPLHGAEGGAPRVATAR